MLQQQISSLQIIEPYHIYDENTSRSSDLEGEKKTAIIRPIDQYGRKN